MDGSLFFARPDLPIPGNGFSLFGPLHSGWLLAISAATAFCCRWYKGQGEAARRRFLRGLALLCAVQEVIKDLLLLWVGTSLLQYLPLHLCGLAIFIQLAEAWRPTPFRQELLYSVTLPGSLAALLFCNWTETPPLHFMHWHSFTIHAYLVIFTAVQLAAGELRPNWKRLPQCFLFLLTVAVPVFFFNKWFDTNYMFLNVPSPGSPLVPLERLLGNPGYILGVAVLFLLVWLPMYLPWTLASRRRERVNVS